MEILNKMIVMVMNFLKIISQVFGILLRNILRLSGGSMSDKNIDYSKYKCPYEHLEKECGHELKHPNNYEDVYGVWWACMLFKSI